MGSQCNSSSSVIQYFCCTGTEYFLVGVTEVNGLTATSNQILCSRQLGRRLEARRS